MMSLGLLDENFQASFLDFPRFQKFSYNKSYLLI